MNSHSGWAPLHSMLLVAGLTIVAVRQLFPSIDADAGSGALFATFAWGVGALALLDILIRPGPSATVPPFAFFVCLSTANSAYKHPSLLMLGEWVGVVAVWTALRRSAGPTAIRLTMAVLIVLAIGEAFLTWQQIVSVIPELLERYQRGEVGMLRELQQAGVDPGFMFQARLEARLPWGTFGHTNALAGFLMFATPLLTVYLASAWSSKPNGRIWSARLLATAMVASVLSALALTKCRSAWIGAAAAIGVLIVAAPNARRFLRRHWHWLAAAGVVLLGAFAWKAGNSWESFRYRLEYWQGTTPIIRAHPLVGVGWGNFRDHYLEHKLVFSSEEIADPHNFLMELAAVAGVPAALAYLIWLGAALRGLFRAGRRLPSVQESESSTVETRHWFPLAFILSIAGGIVLALGYAQAWSELGGVGLAAGLIAMFLLHRWAPAIGETNWRVAIGAAVVGLHVHLLAAGGIGHPGTMLACWGLAASAGTVSHSPSWRRFLDAGMLGFLFIVAWFLGGFDAMNRVVRRDPLLGRIRNPLVAQMFAEERMPRLFGQAVALTPGDADLWAELSRWRRSRMTETAQDGCRHDPPAREAIDRALELQPMRSQFRRQRALLTLESVGLGCIPVGETGGAVADAKRAVERYPNSPTVQAEAAFVLAAAGQAPATPTGIRQALDRWRTVKYPTTTADVGERLGRMTAETVGEGVGVELLRMATRALELDAATPHLDKKLSPAERAWLQGLVDERKRRTGASE